VSRFVYGTKSNVPEYVIKNGETYRIVSDHLGTPRVVVHATTGAIVQRLDVQAFGELILDTAPGWQPFGFAGGLYDPDTGLMRFGTRDYDPIAGEWTAKDPIGFADGPNVYSYVHNNPLNLRDPFGLSTSSAAWCFLKGAAWGAAGAVVVGGVAAVAVTAAGAPVAAVTGILVVAGIAGGVVTGWDIYNQSGFGNWNRVAYDVGSVAGSAAAGAAIAPVIGPAIAGGETTPGWSPAKDWSNLFDPFYPGGSVWSWLGKGPDNAAAGGAAAAAGSGTAMVGTNCECN
jgi:RHS repeat-associated protein